MGLEVAQQEQRLGVVMRMSGGWVGKRRRASAGVSPVRIPVVMSGRGRSWPAAAARSPASGARRLRSMSAARASGRGDVQDPEALALGHRRGGGQPVDGRQERGQGLARPGGRDPQDVLVGGEGVPGADLGRVGAAKAPSNQPRVRAENPNPDGVGAGAGGPAGRDAWSIPPW